MRATSMHWFSGLVVLTWLGMAALAAQENPPLKPMQEYFNPLRGKLEDQRGLKLVGPEAEKFVSMDAEGLRVTLPKGRSGESKFIGANSGMVVQGDFEITVQIEMFKEPEPVVGGSDPSKVHLLVTVNTPPSYNVAGFTRHVRAKWGKQYTTWFNDFGPTSKRQPFKGHPVRESKWRLRLSRTDDVLSYHVAEEGDADFRLLQTYPYIRDDIKDVRVVAQTGGEDAELDFRVTDFRIRGEALPLLQAVAAEDPRGADGAQPAAAPPAPGRLWLWLVLGLAAVLVFGWALTVATRRNQRQAGANS